jgi:hypothetical protein
MSRTCSICAHTAYDAIEVAHQSGASNRRIAAQFNVPETSLRRHFTSHSAPLSDDKRRTTPPSHARNVPPDSPVPHEPPARKANGTIPAEIRPGTQAAFLAAFVELANESGACRAVQIDRATVRWWEEHQGDFSLRYQDAQAQVNDSLRGEMFRRGVKGVAEPVVNMGKIVRNDDGSILTVQKYSDTLLVKLAAARMPAEFREKSQIEMTGNMSVQHDHSLHDDPEADALARQLLLRLGQAARPADAGGTGLSGE